jgi:hypothetical protein
MSLVLPAVLSYDGTPLTESVDGMPRLVSRLVRGLDTAPEVRGQDTVIPGAPGRVPRERIFDRRVIELEVQVLGIGATEAEQRADTRAALDALGSLFAPTRDPASLVVEVEDGSTRSIDARPVNVLHDEGEIPTRRLLSVELDAVAGGWVAG